MTAEATMEEAQTTRRSRRTRYDAAKERQESTSTPQDANAAYNDRQNAEAAQDMQALEWVRGLEISSIKYLGTKVYFEFEHKIQSFKAKTKATSTNDIPESFTAALKNLASHVAKLIFRALDEQNWQA